MNNNKDNKPVKSSRLPAKLSLYIRILVSAYLIYVVYSLRDVHENYKGGELAFFLVAMALFGVIAIWMGGVSAYALIRGKYEGGAMDPETEAVEHDEEG